jgi:hypothetical protein
LRVVLDERYADLAAQFQRAQIAMLRDTLKKYGVVGNAARDICGEFSFDLAMVFDQGELDLDGSSYRSCVTFTADEEVFYVQPVDVQYHEYAFGTTAEVFESER